MFKWIKGTQQAIHFLHALSNYQAVIPAKAGINLPDAEAKMDSRLRGNDGLAGSPCGNENDTLLLADGDAFREVCANCVWVEPLSRRMCGHASA
jgi:hypothetical protein